MQLAFWSSALATGIACGLAAGPVLLLYLGGAVFAVFGVLVWRRAWNLGLAALSILVGMGLGVREVRLAAAPAPVVEDRTIEVVGVVVGGPDSAAEARSTPGEGLEGEKGHSRGQDNRSHLRVETSMVGGKPLSSTLALLVLEGAPALAPGDWVRFSTRLYLPRGFANPGLPDGRLLARGQGIDLRATVRSPTEVQRMDGQRSLLAHARRWAFYLRRAMSRAIDRRLSEPAAGFVRTLVLGERTDVPAETEAGFRAAGATHVLSVSGLHLAVVVALVFHCLRWFVSRLPALALRVSPKVLASLLALPATAFYTLLTGEAVATVRSAIMVSVVLGAAVVNRPFSLSASIGLAALVLLLKSPAALLDVSFQLTFASVIGLGLFSRWLLSERRERQPQGFGRARAWLTRSLSASIAASLLTMPLVAHHFGEITPAAPMGNLVLVPVVELVVLPCGLVGAVLALAHPWLGALPLLVAGAASRIALATAGVFRWLAPVLLVRYPNTLEALLLVAAVACLLQVLTPAARHRRWWFAATSLTLLLALGSLGARELSRRTRDDLRVTFLDVGQGSAILIQGPRGFTALVDGGGRYDERFDTGARIVEPVLRAAGITLDLVVLSHPHPDHLNGLLRIVERFPVGAVWTSGDDGGNPVYGKLMALARDRNVPTPTPGMITHAGMTIEAIGPRYRGAIGVPPGLSTNDGSLVVRLDYGKRRVLLPGDIGAEGEAEILDLHRHGSGLSADVLAMPHHGSRYGSTGPFLDAVTPVLAVASAGRFNRFGLPNPMALNRYAQRGIEVLRTDQSGAVTATMDRLGNLRVVCTLGSTPCPTPEAPCLPQ